MANNVVVNRGRRWIVDRMRGSETVFASAVALGSSTIVSNVTDTALGAEIEDRFAGTMSAQITDSTGDTYRVVGRVDITAARTVRESAIFDSTAAGGDMLVKFNLDAAQTAINGDDFEITFNLDFDSTA